MLLGVLSLHVRFEVGELQVRRMDRLVRYLRDKFDRLVFVGANQLCGGVDCTEGLFFDACAGLCVNALKSQGCFLVEVDGAFGQTRHGLFGCQVLHRRVECLVSLLDLLEPLRNLIKSLGLARHQFVDVVFCPLFNAHLGSVE